MIRRAFTLIELLIVIAVIGILVGIALPRFKGMQDEGNIARAKGELKMFQAAVESYYAHNNSTYPTTLSALLTAIPNIAGTTALPKDPFNGTSDYGYNTTGSYYVIYSVGPSGNGAATVATTGVVTETNGPSCIYATNGTPRDTQP